MIYAVTGWFEMSAITDKTGTNVVNAAELLWFTRWNNTRIVYETRVIYDYTRLRIGLDSIIFGVFEKQETMLF